jgi:tol-pal system protein YbgF
MKKSALLVLLACFGLTTGAGAVQNAYQGNAAYGTPTANASDNAIFEVLGRLEQLQLEVQQLRGMVEEQSQTIADLERKQTNMYSDLDERIQVIAVPNQQAPGAAVQTPPVATTPAAASVVTPPVQPSTPAVVETKPAEAAPATPPPPQQASEKERYQQAYDTLRNGRNAQAIQMFEALQADFPTGELSDNTQYWLGEAYKINREIDKARAAFTKVASQYPQSAKVPDALLKLGYIEFDQQNLAKARDYLTRVTTSYPSSTAAHLAAKKLAQMPQ